MTLFKVYCFFFPVHVRGGGLASNPGRKHVLGPERALDVIPVGNGQLVNIDFELQGGIIPAQPTGTFCPPQLTYTFPSQPPSQPPPPKPRPRHSSDPPTTWTRGNICFSARSIPTRCIHSDFFSHSHIMFVESLNVNDAQPHQYEYQYSHVARDVCSIFRN